MILLPQSKVHSFFPFYYKIYSLEEKKKVGEGEAPNMLTGITGEVEKTALDEQRYLLGDRVKGLCALPCLSQS